MSRPPRLESIHERNKSITYFVTWCVQSKVAVLNNDPYFSALKTAIQDADRWEIEAVMVMPDHIHLLASPFHRDESVGRLAGFLKKRSRHLCGGTWQWQQGTFDHILRSNESGEQKWNYIRQNPVRAGLVMDSKDWPYQIGFRSKEDVG
ncbi:MAG: transposase [Verrucomicrobiota bacterium]